MSKIDTFITPGQQHEHIKAKRKSPGPRYQHLRFYRLAIGERLDIGLLGYRKSGTFSARNCITRALRRVMPWNKVRSRRPVSVAEHATLVAAAVGNIGCQGDAEISGKGSTITIREISIGGNEKTPSA